MPVTNGYCTRDEVKTRLLIGLSDTSKDAQVDNAINTACRTIDGYCRRKFWLDPSPVARKFEPHDPWLLDLVNEDGTAGDIGITPTAVATDLNGDGVFEQTWQTTDYELLPSNANIAIPEAKPWRQLRAIGTLTWPSIWVTLNSSRARVQITARWGYPAIPDPVAEASRIFACKVFKRIQSPEGIGGFDAYGPVRITGEDRDVAALLAGYRFSGGYAIR